MKTISCIVLLLTAYSLFAASDATPIRLHVEVDSEFNKPYGTAWWLNKSVSDKDAKATIVKDEQSNSKCLKIDVPDGQKNASVVSETQFLYIADGTIVMQINLKGKGLFNFDFYCYNEKGKYLGIFGTKQQSTVDSTDWQQFTDSIEMTRFPNETRKIRAVLSTHSSGTIFIDDAVYYVTKPSIRNEK